MYLVGLHIYYKMIHGPYNVKSRRWKFSAYRSSVSVHMLQHKRVANVVDCLAGKLNIVRGLNAVVQPRRLEKKMAVQCNNHMKDMHRVCVDKIQELLLLQQVNCVFNHEALH